MGVARFSELLTVGVAHFSEGTRTVWRTDNYVRQPHCPRSPILVHVLVVYWVTIRRGNTKRVQERVCEQRIHRKELAFKLVLGRRPLLLMGTTVYSVVAAASPWCDWCCAFAAPLPCASPPPIGAMHGRSSSGAFG